jgi:phosphoribosylamine--glycine ligase
VGIKCPKSFEVQTPEELIAQIKKKPGRYVIKPHNSEDKTMSCVGKMDDGEDIIAIMESIISKGQDGEAKGMRVEEHVEGVEIGISGYFNGKKFLSPYIINFEHKKLMDGNVGPNTGEMGTSAVILKKAGKLEQELKKCEPKLAEVGYTGAFDLEFIVNEKGAYCLEPTSRFGYPSIFLHTEALNGELGEFMMGLADGSAEESPFKTECVVGVVMVTPPFPFENAEIFKNEYEGMPILGLTDEIIPHVHFCGVKEKEDKATLAGQMGYVLVVTGSGSTMKEAKKATYDIVEEIIIPDVMYRTDISDRWAKDLPKLQKWGYL